METVKLPYVIIETLLLAEKLAKIVNNHTNHRK